MKLGLKPKETALVIWAIFLGLLFLSIVILRSNAVAIWPVRAADEPGNESVNNPADLTHIRQAMSSMDTMKEWEVNSMANKESTANPEKLTPIIAPSPPEKQEKKGAANEGPDSNLAFSLILIGTGKSIKAVLNGSTLHVGDVTKDGDVVQRIGPTFVVLKPPSGELKRIDMKGRFMPKIIPQPSENSK